VVKISHEQSRRNAARRRRRVAGRHARAGHWDDQPSPMFGSGPVAYEIGGNVDATCFGGIAAVHRLVTRLGIPDLINEQVRLLKAHLPYHESGEPRVFRTVRYWPISGGELAVQVLVVDLVWGLVGECRVESF